MAEEPKKIGIEGLVETLKKENLDPVGLHNPRNFMKGITVPRIKAKKAGKIVLEMPNDMFNNSEDTRQFNKGKYKVMLLFVEDTNVKKE